MARWIRVLDLKTQKAVTREVGHYEDMFLDADERRALDAGRHVCRHDAVLVDLLAYYHASQADRQARALQVVS